jgi:hypothetical protein
VKIRIACASKKKLPILQGHDEMPFIGSMNKWRRMVSGLSAEGYSLLSFSCPIKYQAKCNM